MSNSAKQSESMLVRGQDLDKLLLLAGEVIIASSNQGFVYKNIQGLFDQSAPVDQETMNDSKDLAASTSLLSSDLHLLVQSIRTVDLKDMGFRARRLVRDLSRKTGKLINFEFVGEETTIDKGIVDKLYDPISHQLRNAIDHGIEDAQTRARNGKPKEGLVTLKVYNTDQETIIEIEDDGAGVPMESLRKKGIEKDIIREGEPFNEDVALKLMCTPGVTTSETVSKSSGRGVGMDVVRNSIDGLGGTFYFKTAPNKGTTFTFRIPLASAVNIVDALVVKAEENIFAFPISNVVASISLSKKEISSALNKGKMVNYLGNLLPLQNLAGVLDKRFDELDLDESVENTSILIVEHKGKRVAFTVSEFLAPQKLVIIPFEESLSVTGMVGTTILGGRKLGFIVDVPALISMALDGEIRDSKAKAQEQESLQIDVLDSDLEDEAPDRFVEPEGDTSTQMETATAVREEFVAELEKLFPELNETVFALESDPSDNDKINAAFRLFHTIKGNLIMMGLTRAGETIHCIESVLDYTRSRKVEITPELMDVLMDGLSYIDDAVQNMKAGSWEDNVAEDIVARTAELLPKQTFEREKIGDVGSAEITFSHESEYRTLMHRKNNSPFYRIYIEFDSGSQPSFLVACLIYKRIFDVGDVVGTVPPLSEIERGRMDGRIKILFASNYDRGLLEKSLKDLFKKHYGARLVELTSVSY